MKEWFPLDPCGQGRDMVRQSYVHNGDHNYENLSNVLTTIKLDGCFWATASKVICNHKVIPFKVIMVSIPGFLLVSFIK